MPFDNTSFVESPVKHAEEIAILDRMAEILATPERWCKGCKGYRDAAGNYTSFCLIGALHVAHLGVDALSEEDPWDGTTNEIFAALLRATGGVIPARYNDCLTTTHPDVLDLIARTKASFS